MERQIKQRKETGPQSPPRHEPQTKQHGRRARRQIENPAGTGSEAHDQRALAAQRVLLAVAVIVQHQQRVDRQTAGQRGNRRVSRPTVAHYVIDAAYRNEAEKEDDQQIAPPVIRQRIGTRRIKKREQYAHGPDGDQFRSAVTEQSESRHAGGKGRAEYASLHRAGSDPPFRAGSSRPQPVPPVAAFQIVEQVVDQVRVDLHQKSEQRAQQCLRPAKTAVGIGQRAPDQHGNGGRSQRFGTRGEHPSPEHAGFLRFHRHIVLVGRQR